MTVSTNETPPTVTGTICLEWWSSLTGQDNPATRNTGHLAELRRSRNILDVVECPAYHTLARRFPWLDQDNRLDRYTLDRLAVIAHALPFVRRHDGGMRIGRQMGRIPTGKSSSPVSELRFRRLVQVTTAEDLMPAMRRVIALLDNTVNVVDLSELILWWGTPQRMKRLAFDYYGANDQPAAEKKS